MISDLLFRLRAIFRRRSVEKELDDELRFHFEHEVEKLMRSGLSREEASRRARLALGGLDQVKEECRDARGVSVLEAAMQDLRYGMRGLRRNPGLAILATLTLSLRMTMLQGMRPALLGIGLGAAGAWWLSRYLATLLFDIKPVDFLTYAAMAALLLATALAACYLPGRRVMRIDPAVALRIE